MTASVMIIDDEEAIAWALRKACDREGYTTTVADTAEAGLLAATRTPPDDQHARGYWVVDGVLKKG